MNKDKQIEKKGVLPNSMVPVAAGVKLKPVAGPEYDAEKEIKKFGLAPTEIVEYKDPFDGLMKKIMIDRKGTSDEKLALTLLDDKMSREQKDTVVSMYLFEKGKHGASMLMDLWGYKGTHTKESRQFQSTMRFDFEMFLSTFQIFMADTADMFFKQLPIKVVEVEKEVDGKKMKKEIVQLTRDVDSNEVALALGDMARYFRMTGTLLGKRIRTEVEKRERAKGKGIYIDKDNKPYSIYEDGDIVEVVARDREEVIKEKENGTA